MDTTPMVINVGDVVITRERDSSYDPARFWVMAERLDNLGVLNVCYETDKDSEAFEYVEWAISRPSSYPMPSVLYSFYVYDIVDGMDGVMKYNIGLSKFESTIL